MSHLCRPTIQMQIPFARPSQSSLTHPPFAIYTDIPTLNFASSKETDTQF